MIQVDAKLQIHIRKTASAVFMPARDSDWSVAQVTARLQALLWGPPGSEGYAPANGVNHIDPTKHPRLFEMRKNVPESEWNVFMDKARHARATTPRSSITALGKVERAIARGGAEYTAAKVAGGTMLLDVGGYAAPPRPGSPWVSSEAFADSVTNVRQSPCDYLRHCTWACWVQVTLRYFLAEVLAGLRPRGCVHCKASRISHGARPGQRRLAPRDRRARAHRIASASRRLRMASEMAAA
eukprot:5334476-Prymnesium_polylepis.1